MALSLQAKFIKLSAVGTLVLASATAALPAHAAFPFSSLKQEVPSLAPMVEKVTPAVVNISVKGTKEAPTQINPLEHFFGRRDRQPQEQPFSGLGSGVIIDKDKGYVITNHHVIRGANEIRVTLKDGRTFDAKKLGGDEQSDIAVLKIDPDNLTELELANSDKLRVGDFVVAIGNPFGLGQTVTSGIVSAKGRTGLLTSNGGYEDFIQTDAAINSGNSGGALVNLKGELVGINTAIIAPGGGNVGIGFAIPSVMMQNLADQIIEFGEVKRGMLGIIGGNVTSELANALDLTTAQGAFVEKVNEGSSADKGGLESGDVITHVDGNKIQSFFELRSKVATKGAGNDIDLTIIRNGKTKSITVTLGTADQPVVTAANIHPSLKGATLTNSKTDRGERAIEVSEIEERSQAASQGLEQGDIIYSVNRKRTESVADLREAIENSRGVIALNVIRGNSSLYILIR